MKKRENVPTIRSSAAKYLTFIAATGDSEQNFEMRYQDENIWLTQKMMATLYDVSVQNIGQHIKKILDDDELSPDSVIKDYFITAADRLFRSDFDKLIEEASEQRDDDC